MYRSSQLLNKEIIDSSNQKRLGILSAVAFDKPTGKCLFVTDDGKTFSADKITAKDCIFAGNPMPTDARPVLHGARVYDTTASYCGTVTDCEFGKTVKLSAAILDDGSKLTRGKIYALGDIVLIKTAKSRQHRAEGKTAAAIQHNAPVPLKTAARKPNKRYGDFSFLLGRSADRNITNFQGETMIKRGETVTRDILRQAKVSGKLIELCLHTK